MTDDPGDLITDEVTLLAATGCADLEEYQGLVVDYLDADYPDLMVDTESDDGVTFVAYLLGQTLSFPFTLRQMWDFVDELDDYLEGSAAATGLPEYMEDDVEQEDATQALADFFDISAAELALTVGAGWYAIDPVGLTGVSELTCRWFASGDPAQVLLGIGAHYATIASPTHARARLQGPERLEGDLTAEVELRTEQTLTQLHELVRHTAVERQATFTYCRACRRLTAPEDLATGENLCHDCAQTYLGIIYD